MSHTTRPPPPTGKPTAPQTTPPLTDNPDKPAINKAGKPVTDMPDESISHQPGQSTMDTSNPPATHKARKSVTKKSNKSFIATPADVTKHQASKPARLTDQNVCDYLIQHPDFFIRNADHIQKMRVPHPVRDSVSLVEWHMARARQQIRDLEQGIGALIHQANDNQRLFYRLLTLQTQLAHADSLQDMLQRLHLWAREMGLSTASVRLFDDRWQLDAPLAATRLALSRDAFTPLRLQRFGTARHYLGILNGQELALLLPPDEPPRPAGPPGSVALSLLGEQADLGVLIFTSQDADHYQHGQGTQLLQEIASLLPAQLQHWINRL